MFEFLKDLDIKIFLFLNGINSPTADFLMYWLSHKTIWIPLYAFLIFLLYRQYYRKVIIILILVALLITISDQVSVFMFKNVFLRLRPCHEPALEGLVYAPFGCGGRYGFISSHASNVFALAVFVVLLLRNRFSPYIYGLFIWAALVSYSRIYLGVHYPADIVGGALMGTLEAFFIYALWIQIDDKLTRMTRK